MIYRCTDCGYILKESELDFAEAEYCPGCHAMGTLLEEEEE